jgi:hypothetical protein
VKTGSVAVGFLDPGEWSASFGQSLIDLYLTDAIGSRRMVPNGRQLRNYCGTGGLVAGRNEIAKKFLDDTECEWLFMVDSDMGFAPDTVDRLIDAADRYERPAVGALCFALRRAGHGDGHSDRHVIVPTLYDYVETDDDHGWQSIVDYPVDQLVQVAGTGAACLLLHRRALGKVRMEYGDRWFNPLSVGDKTFSEDLSFCMRLAAVKVPLHVHTGVRTSHYKGGVYLTEHAFVRQPELHAAPAPEGAAADA